LKEKEHYQKKKRNSFITKITSNALKSSRLDEDNLKLALDPIEYLIENSGMLVKSKVNKTIFLANLFIRSTIKKKTGNLDLPLIIKIAKFIGI
jgi:hypothetical protein